MQENTYVMTFDDTVALVQGLMKSLEITENKDSIKECMAAGVSYAGLAKHNFSSVISTSELGPQINAKLLSNLTAEFFNHTSATVESCGALGVHSYKFLVKIFKFIISGEQWMAALRRLKDQGFNIL